MTKQKRKFDSRRRIIRLFLGTMIFALAVLLVGFVVSRLTQFYADQSNLIVLLFFGVVAIVSALVSQFLNPNVYVVFGSQEWWADFTHDISTAMLGAVLTGLLFLTVVSAAGQLEVEQQDIQNPQAQQESDLRNTLIRQAGSVSHPLAVDAIDQLRDEGWLTGEEGILQGADLRRANLHNAQMQEANLAGVNFEYANLSEARLWSANLVEANLWYVNLSGAVLNSANLFDAILECANLEQAMLRGVNLVEGDLWYANLSEVDLQSANLEEAYLAYTNLSGANLGGVNLSGANLREANLSGAYWYDITFDDRTVLPDSESLRDGSGNVLRDNQGNYLYDKYWTPDTDMARYTDPNHPDFWQPEWVGGERCQAEGW